MTVDEFIDHLHSLDLKWVVTPEGYIQWAADDCCPIWAAYRMTPEPDNEDDDAEDYWQAGRALGLSGAQVGIIADAADNRQPFDQTVRDRLLSLALPV